MCHVAPAAFSCGTHLRRPDFSLSGASSWWHGAGLRTRGSRLCFWNQVSVWKSVNVASAMNSPRAASRSSSLHLEAPLYFILMSLPWASCICGCWDKNLKNLKPLKSSFHPGKCREPCERAWVGLLKALDLFKNAFYVVQSLMRSWGPTSPWDGGGGFGSRPINYQTHMTWINDLYPCHYIWI